MLIENTLFGTRDKVKIAIDRIREFEPEEGYYVAFSGGKDREVVLDLVKRAGVKWDGHFNLTTVDPPELIYFIRDTYKVRGKKSRYKARTKAAKLLGMKVPPIWLENIKIHRPEKTMWQLIPERRMPPTRIVRYCCQILKEGGGIGRTVITGVRKQESVKRSKRRMVEVCNMNSTKTYLHPIIDWTKDEVWEYIHMRKLPYCKLYDQGYHRIGCIMCPMAGAKQMRREAEKYPKYAKAYLHAFHKTVKKRIEDGLPTEWKTGQEMYDWWMSERKLEKDNPDQTIIFE